MNDSNTRNSSFDSMTTVNTARLGFWTFAWVASMAVATFGPRFVWDSNTAVTITAILLNLMMGIGMMIAYKKHLKGQDELQRKIQMDALALALGSTVVGGLSYSLLDITNIISFDAEISHIIFLTSFTYMAGIFFGQRRYK